MIIQVEETFNTDGSKVYNVELINGMVKTTFNCLGKKSAEQLALDLFATINRNTIDYIEYIR